MKKSQPAKGKTVTIRCDDDVVELARIAANIENRTLSNWIHNLISEEVTSRSDELVFWENERLIALERLKRVKDEN